MGKKKSALEQEKEALEVQLKRLEVKEKKRKAKAERAEGRAKAAKANLELSRLTIEHLALERDAQPVLERSRGIFRLESSVYERVLQLVSRIQKYADENPGGPITLHIFSPGGSVLHGFALYDLLRGLSDAGHEVTTEVRGFCGSMASVIFLAGDRRLIGRQSTIHQHEVSTITYGKLADVEEDLEFTRHLYGQIRDIYVERTKITAKEFEKKTRKTEWMAGSAEALKLGIATEVV